MNPGELFIFGYEPHDLGFVKDFASQFGLGGIIIFDRNFASAEKLKNEIAEIKDVSGPGLIVCVDQEGGNVNRLEGDFPTFPSARYYADNSDREGLEIACRTSARSLAEIGINMNLVPVCDVLTADENQLLRTRAFGNDPHTVSEYSALVYHEYSQNGIACCAKHFPGLGSSNIDPHVKTATTEISLEDFRKVHWKPFKNLIESGIETVMTTHLHAANLDPANIATFSNKICQTYLRNELGFEGVIFSDDLAMGAIKDMSADEIAVRCLDAGHDMLLFCHHRDDQRKAFDAVQNAIKNGRLDEDSIMQKISRILKLKDKIKKNASAAQTV